ncbi:MAG: tRNA (adenosine(37)-N6)-threonylcarbamoyltransferase complex transferase subunit TsaD, partial [bacterium]
MLIFAIETSCDETSAAVIKSENGKVEILSNIVSSQIDIHREYGGVVPEIAAREHVKNINWVIDDSLRLANIKPEKIDLMAVTAGPGLITSLIVGVEAAKALSLAWQKPLLPVNHIFAHLAANFASGEIAFPAV